MRYTYKFREIQNELNSKGLKVLLYKEGKKGCFFVAKNEVILSKHILLCDIIKQYKLDEGICVDISNSNRKFVYIANQERRFS